MELKPGLNINIITNIDYRKEILETRNSLVHDIRGNKIVIAQTDPPISRALLDQNIFVSYLVHEGGRTVRYGLPVKIIEFINKYALTSENSSPAVVLLRKGDKEEYNLRMFYRLEPPGNSGLEIFTREGKLNIIDISLGGASVSHQKTHSLAVNDELRITLVIGEAAHEIDCRVLRLWEPEVGRLRHSIEFASIQFLNIGGHAKNQLGRKIRDIERELRSKEING